MSEEPFSDEEWDAYFDGVSQTEDEQYERLKWGWNPRTGEAEVWEVGGAGRRTTESLRASRRGVGEKS